MASNKPVVSPKLNVGVTHSVIYTLANNQEKQDMFFMWMMMTQGRRVPVFNDCNTAGLGGKEEKRQHIQPTLVMIKMALLFHNAKVNSK